MGFFTLCRMKNSIDVNLDDVEKIKQKLSILYLRSLRGRSKNEKRK
jgi:hypothetical protein